MTEDPREDPELQALLRTLDHDLPVVTVEDVIARAERRSFRWSRIAAAVVATLVLASASYALPGSPVRGWVDGLLSRAGIAESGRGTVPETPADAAPGGMALDPAEPLTVVFVGPLRGHVRITPTEGGDLVARTSAGGARYTSEPGRLVVEMLAPDTLDLLVPRSARRVEVLAGARSVFLKEGVRSSAAVPAGADGRFVIPLDTLPPEPTPR